MVKTYILLQIQAIKSKLDKKLKAFRQTYQESMQTRTKHFSSHSYAKQAILRANRYNSSKEDDERSWKNNQSHHDDHDDHDDQQELFEEKSRDPSLKEVSEVDLISEGAKELFGKQKQEDLERNNIQEQNSWKRLVEMTEQSAKQADSEKSNDLQKNKIIKKKGKNKVDTKISEEKKENRKFQKQKSDYNCQILRATVKKLHLRVSESAISSGPKNQKSKAHFFKFLKVIGTKMNNEPTQVSKFKVCYEECMQKKLMEIGEKFSPRFIKMVSCECERMRKQIYSMFETNDFDYIPEQSYKAEETAFNQKAKLAYKECVQALQKSDANEKESQEKVSSAFA